MSDDNFIRVTPMVHVADIDQALGFFVDVLGFRAGIRSQGYAYVWRETVGIRLWQTAAAAAQGDGRYGYYIDVHDVDRLYDELLVQLEKLPQGHVYPPTDHDYGQREMLVMAPDGNWICFGMQMARQPQTAPLI